MFDDILRLCEQIVQLRKNYCALTLRTARSCKCRKQSRARVSLSPTCSGVCVFPRGLCYRLLGFRFVPRINELLCASNRIVFSRKPRGIPMQ